MRTPKDWGQPCPNPECTHYNRMKQGNVSAIATYLTQSGKRRIFRCHTCEAQFSETRDTVFFDLRTAEEKVMMALKMLLVRVDLAGIGFVLGVTEETVLAWLRRAAHQAAAINRPLLRDLPVTQVQLDEMWNFIERKHARETDAAGESLPDGEDGRQWVWISFAPEFRLMIAAVVGPRTLDTATEVVAATKARVAGIPAFFSDGFTCYLAALIAAFHVVTTFARTGKRGRPRKPLYEPHPELVYGQLVKEKYQGKLRTLSTRVVLGAERLTQLGLTISTALVERVNLTLRQALAPLARKTSSFCKDRERMQQRVVFFQAFYNVARPHMSLRQPLPLQECLHQGAIRPRWRTRTPAMAAGVTNHVWTFRELLTAKFEPLDSQSISG
jgi:IS1 family transposase/transposase-like protein